MRGHIRKRGKTWSAVVYVGRSPSGNPRLKWYGGYRTRKEAQSALTRILTSIDKGTYAEPSRQTFGNFLQDWLEGVRPDLAPSTVPGYEIAVHKPVLATEHGLAEIQLQKLRAPHLRLAYARMREAGLSATTVRRVHAVARRALAEAVQGRLLETNRAADLSIPKPKRKPKQFWTAQEAARFLESIREHRLRAVFHLAVATGMRRSEILGLRWQDVDLGGDTLRVEQTLTAPRYRLAFGPTKTDHARRSVDLDAETVAVLREHKRRQLQERLAFGPDCQDSHPQGGVLVFRNEDGSPLVPLLVTNAMRQALRAAGLTRAVRPFHGWRDTRVALLGEAGVSAKVAQEQLGHSDPGFTLREYGGTFRSQHRQAADAVAALVARHR